MLENIIKTKKKQMGITPKRASKELTSMKKLGLHSTQRKAKKGMWSRKVGVYSKMKKMQFIEQKSSKGRSYTRTYNIWTRSEKRTVLENKNLSTEKVMTILEKKYPDRVWTQSSVGVMKSRLK